MVGRRHRVHPAACFADVALAHALDGPFCATRRALAAGTIDVDRAAVVHAVHALTQQHDTLPEGTHSTAEQHLLDLGTRFDARTLRALGKRLCEVVCCGSPDDNDGRPTCCAAAIPLGAQWSPGFRWATSLPVVES